MRTFHIRFYENRKIYFSISIGIMLIGLIFNMIFGTQLDIQFKGGAVIKYAYTGEIKAAVVEQTVESAVKRNVSVVINSDVKSASTSGTKNNVTLSFAGTDSLSLANQKAVQKALSTSYPNAKFSLVSSDSVNPSMGQSFFAKCLVAVLIAFLLLDIYIAFRFRKIGGTAAGLFAIVALLHDVAMVYFTFIIFRIPLNDNFIAVVLTILGYSLNDTIVIYDRIRENRRLLGAKVEYGTLVDNSINVTLTRSLYTAGCTFASIAVVFIVGSVYNLSSVTTFALPMMVGIVTGCYSSICIAGPLYVMWENHKLKVAVAAHSAKAKEELPKAPAPSPAPKPSNAAPSEPAAQKTANKPSAAAPKPAPRRSKSSKKSRSSKKKR